ncbi:hypothetical protein [Hansschlegelia sp. KR7-227]|uniref:hypothetical protein n=1 Tax=Hansschlegelia sp. KR7-227 TaxID=3400914 RepID=UPI003C0703BB
MGDPVSQDIDSMRTKQEQGPPPGPVSEGELEARYEDLHRAVLAEEEAQERREDAYRGVAERERAAGPEAPKRTGARSALPHWAICLIVALAVACGIWAGWAAYRVG